MPPRSKSAGATGSSSRSRPAASAHPFEDRGVAGNRRAAHVEDAGELRPLPCMSLASSAGCIAAMTCIDRPVAPIWWPSAFSPPEGFTRSRPPWRSRRRGSPGRLARRGRKFGDDEAAMRLHEARIIKRHACRRGSPFPRPPPAVEARQAASRQRQRLVGIRPPRGAGRLPRIRAARASAPALVSVTRCRATRRSSVGPDRRPARQIGRLSLRDAHNRDRTWSVFSRCDAARFAIL